jgi:hypothetical protein
MRAARQTRKLTEYQQAAMHRRYWKRAQERTRIAVADALAAGPGTVAELVDRAQRMPFDVCRALDELAVADRAEHIDGLWQLTERERERRVRGSVDVPEQKST